MKKEVKNYVEGVDFVIVKTREEAKEKAKELILSGRENVDIFIINQ